MKNLTRKLFFYGASLLLSGMLVGCIGKESTADSSGNDVVTDSEEVSGIDESRATDELGGADDEAANDIAPSPESDGEKTGDKKGKETLSMYSTEQIEYARIWLQLGANQEIDELNVRHFPAGTPLNPNDDTSAAYPEDVVQLAGSRLVDGSVTYSSNGDGTIHIYNVPLRWDGRYPAGEKFYTDIITQIRRVYVDPGEDEKIIDLIQLLQVH
ncbi:hypothetical protein ACIQXU_17580 [Peribacillus sp. NPDC097284]|uniref:hypothetical protein n=1 Tax=Peribacillus sp. NPDC097284 TaxID=3364401 RepID=UPI003823D728